MIRAAGFMNLALRFGAVVLVSTALEGWPATASAQPLTQTSTALTEDVVERLRRELREEIKSELREELLRDIEEARGAPSADAPPSDAFAEEGWKWEEPVRPELNLLELDGYFRFRYDFFNDLDLATYYNAGDDESGNARESGPFVPGLTSPPVPLCDTDVGQRQVGQPGDPNFVPPEVSCFNNAGESNSLGGANIRFRLEPTLNVYEDIKIKAQIDILDNLVLGTTPDSLYSPLSPLAALSQTQISPTAGINTIWRDSIRVKRVWGEAMTPLGLLSFGRMPNHFGMGVTANDGNGIDMDFGDTVDRIQFAAQIGDFMIAPAFDWAASGPSSVNTLLPQGQPFDRDQRDDVDQYVLTVTKVDGPETRERKLANDEIVYDFGAQLMWRIQALDSQVVGDDGSVNGQTTSGNTLERGASIFQYSAWGEVRWRKLTVTAEYSGMVGHVDDVALPGPYTQTDPDGDGFARRRVDFNQHGGALRGSYKLLNDALHIELMVVAASGDDAPGWGVFPLLDRTPVSGNWDGNQAPAGDDTISNFRFDPDFIVDLIFWRQLVGLVTDAFIVRPSVQYDLTKELGGRLDLIYSRAWFGESTPSGSFADAADQSLGGLDPNLGFEADVTLFYRSERGFSAQLQYGIFVPMDGLDRQTELDAGQTLVPSDQNRISTRNGVDVGRLDAQVAHTIQALLAIAF